jgi:hypothetical protein
LIFALAREVVTKFSQSRLGPASFAFEVMTSTMSPDSSLVESGSSRPLIRVPTQRLPTSVCTA